MYRYLALLLTMVLVFVTLGSCVKEVVDDLSAESEQSEVSAQPEYEYPKQAQAIDNLLTGEINREGNRQNILLGREYVSTPGSGDNGAYEDTGKKLTDGIALEGFDKYNWVGYRNQSKVVVDFDLGEVVQGVADVVTGALHQIEYGISLPTSVELQLSTDGTDYVKVSRMVAPTKVTDTRRYEFRFCLQQSADVRYIRLVFDKSHSAFMFVDEISAYTYSEDNPDGEKNKVDYYPAIKLEAADEVYWDKSEPDYNKSQNLALNKQVYVSSFASLDEDIAIPSSNTHPSQAGLLTDGKYALSPSWDSTYAFRSTRGDGREIIIDLEKISTVKSAKGEFIAHVSWGVRVPEYVGFAASINGTDWQSIGTAKIEYDEDKDAQSCRFETTFAGEFKARYVKVSFLNFHFAAISEIEIHGTKAISSKAKNPDPNARDITRLSDRYMTPDRFLGIENILCTPICYGDGKVYDPIGMVTKEEFLPYVGYYEDGELKGTFMDTFLFSPCAAFTNPADKIRLDGWKFYIDSHFVEDTNLDALNQAAIQVGEELGIADYKVNIFVSMLRPVPYTPEGVENSFGDIDGDGVDDSLVGPENRKKALKWMVDIQLKMLEDSGFDRLELVGFYWQEEFINVEDEAEIKAFEYIRDYVRGMGYKIMWIPYYRAEGFDKWKDFDFDLACLQPNYAFDYTSDIERLGSTAKQAKLHGMCVELEINSYTNLKNIIRYKQYLQEGVKYGYMDAVKVYYHGTIPSDLTLAKDSPDPYTASVYKDTYMFAKGLLDETYTYLDDEQKDKIQIDDENVVAPVGIRKIDGTMEVEGASGYEVSLYISPKYGDIEVNPDGYYVYRPIRNFIGEDYLELKAIFPDGSEVRFGLYIEIEDHGGEL